MTPPDLASAAPALFWPALPLRNLVCLLLILGHAGWRLLRTGALHQTPAQSSARRPLMPLATRCLSIAVLFTLAGSALADNAPSAEKLDLGVGLGVAYGLIGFNAEVGEGPVVGTGNLGWCDFWAWGLGARWYFAPPAGSAHLNRGWRAGIQYGIVGFLNNEDDWFFPVNNRGAEGLCLSLGYRWDDGDAEIGIPLYSLPEGYDDQFDMPVQISFGIRLGGL